MAVSVILPGTMDFQPIIIVVVIIVVIALAIYRRYKARLRREALAKLAKAKGWEYRPRKDWAMDGRFGMFSCLQQGSKRYAYNVLKGQVSQRHMLGFDYHYETYSRDSKGRRRTHHHYFSAVLINSGLPLKSLVIRPEHFFDKVTEFFGYDDIDFESSDFSRKFYVKSPDKKWAFDVIHQETMEFMLNSPTFHLDFQGPHVMAYHKSSTFDIEEFGAAIAVIEGILNRLPEYLLRELKGQEQ
ncbi:MAG: hypothetical protein JSV03_13790 [Planctomycetota bacterium]|nr:MAG: hypothetical protein JSV03_13790 [Planctomycetota bacterium]